MHTHIQGWADRTSEAWHATTLSKTADAKRAGLTQTLGRNYSTGLFWEGFGTAVGHRCCMHSKTDHCRNEQDHPAATGHLNQPCIRKKGNNRPCRELFSVIRNCMCFLSLLQGSCFLSLLQGSAFGHCLDRAEQLPQGAAPIRNEH